MYTIYVYTIYYFLKYYNIYIISIIYIVIVPETGLRFPTFPCFCPSLSIFHEIKRLFVAVLSHEMWKTLPVAGRQSSGRTFQLGFVARVQVLDMWGFVGIPQ